MRAFLIVSVLSTFTACAIGQTHDYRVRSTFSLVGKIRQPVLVGVVDHRNDDKKDESAEFYTGVVRGGYNIPFPVKTASGKPLADDLGYMITETLKSQRIEASQILIRPRATLKQARDGLTPTGQGLGLLVILKKWWSDTASETTLTCDVVVEVIDPSGQVIARRNEIDEL